MENDQQKKNHSGGISVGSSSILVIFVVLALTAFATLALASANSDLRLTKRIAGSTSAYYSADAQGVEYAAQLLDAVHGLSNEEVANKASELGWTVNGTLFKRSVEIDEGQILQLTAKLSAGRIEFTEWKLVNNTVWEEEEGLNVWADTEESNVQSKGMGLSPLPIL